MRNYATQMEAARKRNRDQRGTGDGSEKGADDGGGIDALCWCPKVAICANKIHACISPEGMGSMLKTKINVNLGVSRDCKDYNVEMEKVMEAVRMGAHAIMDLCFQWGYGTVQAQRLPAGVSGYDWHGSGVRFRHSLPEGSGHADCQRIYRRDPLHAQDGVDFGGLCTAESPVKGSIEAVKQLSVR